MGFFCLRSGLMLTSLTFLARALDGIVVPDRVAANTNFQVTFQGGNSDHFRVYLAASLGGTNGPACYLTNSSTLTSPISLNIPSSVGESANYYTIAIGDLTTGQGVTFSNRFNLTGANGTYSDYENHLGGAAFWSPDNLPCTAYSCARQCAQADYPDDMTQSSAYATMKQCILQCPDVSPAASQTAPVHAVASTTSEPANEALVTLGPGLVMTAFETVETGDSSTITEAILGAVTLTLGGAEATISSKAVSLASTGVEVDGSSTVPFSSATSTASLSSAATTASGSAAVATSSHAAANRHRAIRAALAGIAGLAVFI